jgi:hypothetical protein
VLPSIITDEPTTETTTIESEREKSSTVEGGEGSESTTTTTTTMEPNESGEGEERISRAGMRSRGSGSREGGQENWPRKFITLSIWSMRGGVKKGTVDSGELYFKIIHRGH